MFCLTLFEGLLLGKQKVVSSHFFHNWLLFVWLCYICYGTVVLQFVLNEMRWSILRLSAGLDLNHAWWHVSIRDNILQQSVRLVPIPGLNIIPLIQTKIYFTLLFEIIKSPKWMEKMELKNQKCRRSTGVFPGRDPPDPCTDELLPYYTGARIISFHQSDYPHMPHHDQDLSWHHPIKPFHTRTTLWCIGGLLNNNWQRCKTKPGSNVPKRVFIHERDQSADGKTIRIRSSED